jgi:hypothetical protein
MLIAFIGWQVTARKIMNIYQYAGLGRNRVKKKEI